MFDTRSKLHRQHLGTCHVAAFVATQAKVSVYKEAVGCDFLGVYQQTGLSHIGRVGLRCLQGTRH